MRKTKRIKEDTRRKPKQAKNWMPLVLPEEDIRLLDRGDFIGHEYLRARRVRAKRGRTAAERKFLKRHAAVEAQIQSDPQAVLKQALAAVDAGSALLLKLIRSSKLFHDYQGRSWDEAFNGFASRVEFMNQQFVRLAEDGTPKARFHLWYQAMNLAGAVVRLAAAFPEDFRAMAESSLTMPSLRARNPKFSCDAEAIAGAIHLAEKHAAPDIHDNRSRLGALCHFLVAQLVGEVQRARNEKEHFEREAALNDSKDLIPDYVHPDWRQFYEESWKLPELRSNASAWWQGQIRSMLKGEFDRMKRHSTRNPALWQELARATNHGNEKARWHALEKYCFNKLQQVAGKAVKPD